MHAGFYNHARFEIVIRTHSPLLIKAGSEGEGMLDPILPNMNFVRTRSAGHEPQVYIPGSSLRGVVRSYAEKLIRSVEVNQACDPNSGKGSSGDLKEACFKGDKTTDLEADEAYNKSCYACRLFGNTAMAGRVRFEDLYADGDPTLETRYGVAIDRVTGSVAQGPFEMEIATEAAFKGDIDVMNFTLGQLGVLSAALLDMNDGLAPVGFGKSKGFGRVKVAFNRFCVRTLKDMGSKTLRSRGIETGKRLLRITIQ